MIILNYEESMVEKLVYATSFDVFINGETKHIKKRENEFEEFFKRVKSLFKEGRVMPAFGVSIHEATLNEITSGEWIQINFEIELSQNQLPFTSLLFKLEKTGGINLIRKNKGFYEGRCIFLDFDKEIDLQKFFNLN